MPDPAAPRPHRSSELRHGERRSEPVGSAELERVLLRKGVGALVADRHRCADCHRTPLVGEHVYLYAGDEIVCELCRALRRSLPVSSDIVRHSEFGHTVRVTARAA